MGLGSIHAQNDKNNTRARTTRGESSSKDQQKDKEREIEIKDITFIKESSFELMDVEADTLPGISLPTFNQMGSVPFYYDKKIKSAIDKALKSDDTVTLNNLLFDYIGKFGIENFRIDNKYLFAAARLKERQRDTTLAMHYYDLAFKHNSPGYALSRDAYDSLKQPYISEWVPIEKYYEIVKLRQKIDTIAAPKVLLPMGYQINSEDPEYAPYTHHSDKILIFTSRRDVYDYTDPTGSKNEDLFISIRQYMGGDSSVWDTAFKLSAEINTKFNEGSACLSHSGRFLFFTRCGEVPGGYGDCDIYRAEEIKPGFWGNVKNLGSKINTSFWESQPHITPDGKTLFFTSNRDGGMGGMDLYYSTQDKMGNWLPAKNLGPMINTPNNEATPFYNRINQTLYFSSNGQLLGFGGFDIYKSRRLINSWEAPKNVGPLVNTPGNEYYFSIDGRGYTIFYARSDGKKHHLSQDFDLYSFPMPMEARPDAITTFKGYALDSKTGKPLTGVVLIVDLDSGVEIAPKKINPENGYFEFDLIKNNRYRVYILGNNFLTVRKDMRVEKDTTFKIFTTSLEQDKPIVFESLKFGSNSFRLRTDVNEQLDYLAGFMLKYPMFKLDIEGHTDSDGEEAANNSLSDKRAKSIAQYLENKGVNMARLSARGYGESRPIVPNDIPENKEKNRRVEFKLYFDTSYKGDKPLPTKEELFFRTPHKEVEDY